MHSKVMPPRHAKQQWSASELIADAVKKINSPLINAAIYSEIVRVAGESEARRVCRQLNLDPKNRAEDVEIVPSFGALSNRSAALQPPTRKLSIDDELDRVQEQVLEK